MEIAIRNAQAEDFPGVCRIMEEVHGLHRRNRPDIYREFDRQGFQAHFEELLADSAWALRVAQSGEEILGMAITVYRQTRNAVLQPRLVAWMEDLAVREEFQGKGVGRALFQDARQQAASRGADAMELMVWGFNGSAGQFYEKMGLVVKSRILELPLRKEGRDG